MLRCRFTPENVRFTPKSGLLLFHQVRFVSDSLVAISVLFPTLATAASISSVVLLRRLRIRRAKSLVVMTTRLRGCFGLDEVATAVLRWINNVPPNYFSLPITLLEEEIV